MADQSREITFPAPTLVICPQCHNNSNMVMGPIDIPVRIKVFFVITFSTTITIEYCPKCGRLKVNVKT